MLDSGRSGLSGRSSGGLLGGLNENDDDDDDLMEDSSETSSSRGSLTQRSGRLSEQFRPSDPPRGFGSFKSREELKKAQQSKSAKSDLDLPGFPTFRP